MHPVPLPTTLALDHRSRSRHFLLPPPSDSCGGTFSGLDHGLLALRPVDSLAPLSELTRFHPANGDFYSRAFDGLVTLSAARYNYRCLCPSLPNLRGRLPSLVRLVHRYYDTVRLLRHVRVRIAACGLRGPALIVRPRRAGDLPVLVHVVSQRARVLRLRRTDSPLAFSVAAVLPSSHSE